MAVGLVPVQLARVDVPETRSQRTALGQDAFAKFMAQAERGAASAGLVKPERTPISGSEAASAIERAYTELTGHAPSKGTLAILTSQWSLETSQGQHMYNYNFAGLKGRSPEGYSACLTTREGSGATERTIKDGFRAYSGIDAGAKDYVSLLVRKYAPAIQAAEAEDPSRFAAELKAGGYYSGDETRYAAALVRLGNQAMGEGFDALGGDTSSEVSAVGKRPYFLQPLASPLPSWDQLSWRDAGFPVALGADNSSGTFSTETADRLKDEISRAAMRIAARYGA
jgi:hypothetical protein